MAVSMEYIEEIIRRGPYTPDWASITQHNIPGWFSEAKFGIFTHWGLYSVPEYRNEWYSRNMYIQGYPEFDYHRKTYGEQKDFGYKDFIQFFSAENFDANRWLDAFADSGAQYYVPVSEHHDGYQMYRSEISQWNTWDTGPHRDIIGELRDATIAHNLHFAISNHRAEHWWFMGHGLEFESDVHSDLHRGDFYWPAEPEPDNQDICSIPAPDEEFLNDWLLRVCEIVKEYQPEFIYFDWWIQHRAFKPYLKKFAAFYYNFASATQKSAAICFKDEALAWRSGIVDIERGGFEQAQPFVWQMDTSIARNSWCYTSTLDYKDSSEILCTLIDVVSKNGNLLLNVGPRADGSLAQHDLAILHEIGQWLRVNGEGIYRSQPWKIALEGEIQANIGAFSDQHKVEWTHKDFRFTSRDGNIYVYCLNPTGKDSVTVKSFASYTPNKKPIFHGIIKRVEQLGIGNIEFSRDSDGLHLPIIRGNSTDASRDGGLLPIGYKLTID